MREVGPDLWRWLEEGAHVYVCGDAKRMAKDVEAVLVEIVGTNGKKTSRRGGRVREQAQEGRPLPARRLLRDAPFPLAGEGVDAQGRRTRVSAVSVFAARLLDQSRTRRKVTPS